MPSAVEVVSAMGRQSVRVSDLSTHENAELRRGRNAAKSPQGQSHSSGPQLLPWPCKSLGRNATDLPESVVLYTRRSETRQQTPGCRWLDDAGQRAL